MVLLGVKLCKIFHLGAMSLCSLQVRAYLAPYLRYVQASLLQSPTFANSATDLYYNIAKRGKLNIKVPLNTVKDLLKS